jgi:DNA-binding FadR family transcriptional regulator
MTTELSALRRGSLVDEVIERLRAQIVSGVWPVNTRIPPEAELVAVLQVGRGTVREAVRALAHAGLLDVRQGDGTYVRARSELAGALRRELAHGVTPDQIQEARRAIEVEAARLAAARRTDDDLALCELALADRAVAAARLSALRDAAADTAADTAADADMLAAAVAGLVDADTRFHQAVVAAAHNPVLLDLYLQMDSSLRELLTVKLPSWCFGADDRRGHHGLVDAVRARDQAGAAAAALRNVLTSAEEAAEQASGER